MNLQNITKLLQSKKPKSTLSDQAKSVFSGMLTLAIGATAAKVIGAACIPLLTRIYTPELFGHLSVYSSLLIILTPIATLRYNLAIPLPRLEKAASCLAALSLACLITLVTLVTLLLFFYKTPILSALQAEKITPYWLLIPFGLLSYGLYDLLTLWAIRFKDYKGMAKSAAFQSLGDSSTKIIAGISGITGLGLILGQAVGPFSGSAFLAYKLREPLNNARRSISLKRAYWAALRYKEFPIYRLPSQLLLVLSMQAPLLFFARNFGAETTGQLGLALMAISLPMSVLGNSMSNAYYGEISSLGKHQTKRILSITHSVIFRLALLSILPATALLIWGDWIFEIIFGKNWSLAGTFSSILALYLFSQFIQAPVAKILFVYEGHKLLFYLNLQRALLVIITFYATWLLSLSPEISLGLYSAVLSAHYIISIISSLKFVSNHPTNH